MNSTLKVFGLLIVFFTLTLIGLLIGINVHAQELSMEEATEVEQIKLRASDIQYSEKKQIPIFDGIDKIIGYNDVVDYFYLGNEVDATNVVFKNNEHYSNIEKLNDNTFKIWNKIKYYKNDNGQVQEILDDRVSQKIWSETKIKTTSEKISALLHTPYALADTYIPESDDAIYSYNTTWNNCYNAPDSNRLGLRSDESWPNNIRAYYDGTYYFLDIFHIIFDTSAITDTDEISTSSLWLYGSDKGGSGLSSVVVESTANNPITKTDFTEFNTTELSNAISQDNFNASGWNEYILNSTGTSTISKTGLTKLALIEKNFHLANSAPSQQTAARYMAFYSSRHTGSDYDPYLVVNTYAPEEEPENPTALYPCSIPSNTRIDWITGCKNIYGSSTASTTLTAIEYYYYQIPLAIWIVFGTCFIYLFVRLRFEYIIRFRK